MSIDATSGMSRGTKVALGVGAVALAAEVILAVFHFQLGFLKDSLWMNLGLGVGGGALLYASGLGLVRWYQDKKNREWMEFIGKPQNDAQTNPSVVKRAMSEETRHNRMQHAATALTILAGLILATVAGLTIYEGFAQFNGFFSQALSNDLLATIGTGVGVGFALGKTLHAGIDAGKQYLNNRAL